MKNLSVISAGVIIYHRAPYGKIEYLLLQYIGNYWDFAKGKMEQGETFVETALREVMEETGLLVELDDTFFHEISYSFVTNTGQAVNKKVVFFVGKALTKNIILSREHKNFVWLPFDKALPLITYQNAKDLLIEVDAYLIKSNSVV